VTLGGILKLGYCVKGFFQKILLRFAQGMRVQEMRRLFPGFDQANLVP
jgi:hypothetical protein